MAKPAVFCATCGHTRTQHSPIDGVNEGCWNSRCQDGSGASKCMEFLEPSESAKRPVDRQVAPVGHAHPDTAKVAVSMARLKSGTRRKETWAAVRDAGLRGMTVDELEQRLGRSHQSVSATVNTLMTDLLLVDSGQRRPTRYGHDAIVWVVPGLPASAANS